MTYFSKDQVFRQIVRWADYLALDYSIYFASRQRDEEKIVWQSAKLLADCQ